MKKIVLYFPFFILFAFYSCSDEPIDSAILNGIDNGGNTNGGGNGSGSNSGLSIYDKWWYDSNDYAADIYFHSDGVYEQRIILLGIELTSDGDWFWLDESEGIMKIENLSGNNQLASEAWFKITNIQGNTIDLQQSSNGTNYSPIVYYLDTDN